MLFAEPVMRQKTQDRIGPEPDAQFRWEERERGSPASSQSSEQEQGEN